MAFDEPRPELSLEDFRLIRDLVYDHCGISFREENRYIIERRLVGRLRALELPDFAAYHRYLRHGEGRKAELEAAIEALTTNETYFFREPNQLRAFREELLPVLHEEKARSRRLRIWSAGCSTGEEAYTIAILLLEHGGFAGWDVEVFGSDISRKVLAVARRGEYGQAALRAADPPLVKRWLEERSGKWAVKDEVRQLVSFGHLNLLDEEMLALVGKVDAIFCRNVMIYFDLAARRQVLKSFLDKLVPGGYLLLGHSESLLNVTADFELVHLKNDLVYRKPKGAR